MRTFVASAALAAALTLPVAPAQAAGESVPLLSHDWSFDGIFGSYDRASLQRGLQVFRESCSACHGMKYVAFRTLTDLGYTEEEVRAIAAEYFIQDGPDDTGAMFERPGIPSDMYPNPWANEAEAAMIHGKAPPDLSLMAKARLGGPTYIYSLLQGYADPSEHDDLLPGNYWNEFYPGHIIAMAQPLYPDQVVYTDGTQATLPQMAADVSNFLMWAAEPKLEERKDLGIKVMLFCTVMAGVFYAMNRRIWGKVKK
ncbi:MAG: cytochrome c1 [Pseudomonadota bacterium]